MNRAVTSKLPLLLGLLIAVGPVSTDMYLPAFPQIAHSFAAPAAPQESLAAYFVGLAIGQMTQGALSDRLGRRTPLLAGLALYSLASLGCALAGSVTSLVVFRALSALGASAGVVIPRAMVRDLADGPEAAKLFSRLMLVMGVAPICSPLLGSAVMAVFSWRAIFATCVVYGALALALTWRYLPDTLPPARRTLIGPVETMARYGRILRERGFLAHALLATANSASIFAYLAATPQIFIDEFGWPNSAYALLFGANSIAYIGYNQLNPALVNRFGLHRVISFATAVLLATSLLLAGFAFTAQGAFHIETGLLLSELAFGLLMPCTLVGALSRHQSHAGSASALLGTLQYSGGAVSGLAVGWLADGTARPMGLAMLLCALLALAGAVLRPKLLFSTKE
ncbi:multidrug effflux MFS transporter [Acidocella sp.]|uniref:multidrug effflux MFS transporter n=1 Tax=Acidocella sp. TaxID=50710 RepID=UPI00262A49C8|nr:multidrug effflux MFS transporter [Acidocella sp.]